MLMTNVSAKTASGLGSKCKALTNERACPRYSTRKKWKVNGDVWVTFLMW